METKEMELSVEGRFCMSLIQVLASMNSIPEDTVKRAIKITRCTFSSLEKEGWMKHINDKGE